MKKNKVAFKKNKNGFLSWDGILWLYREAEYHPGIWSRLRESLPPKHVKDQESTTKRDDINQLWPKERLLKFMHLSEQTYYSTMCWCMIWSLLCYRTYFFRCLSSRGSQQILCFLCPRLNMNHFVFKKM